MWIDAPRNLPPDLDQKITTLIGERVDREDSVWLNIDSGALIVLAANGGWRTPETSAYHVIHISPVGQATDVSWGLLDGPVKFDHTETGAETYKRQYAAAISHLEKTLNVVQRRLDF